MVGVFKATIGLLMDEGRDWLAEKLKEGDVTDEKFRDWIVREINAMNLKLDAIAWKDLGASMNFFKEGLTLMYKVLEKVNDSEHGMVHEASMETLHACSLSSTAGQTTVCLAEGMKNFTLTDSGESKKEALYDAKKRFKDARKKATEAFSNSALRPAERVLAMQYRIMATLLEKVDNPASALTACKLCLEQLHAMTLVQKSLKVELKKSFKFLLSRDERREIISAVCQINHVVYVIAEMVGDLKTVLNWPCIILGEEQLDPLRDVRVVKVMRKLHKQQSGALWSFGQEEGHELKGPQSIAANTRGQLVVTDNMNCELKVYDSKGKCLSHCPLLGNDDKAAVVRVRSVATDQNDRMYILVDSRPANTVYVLSDTQTNRNCFSLEERLGGRSLTVNNNNQVLVLVEEDLSKTPSACMTISIERKVEVYRPNGRLVRSFGQGILKDTVDITATNDGSVMVLQGNSCVHVFDAEGSHVHQFQVMGNTGPETGAAMTFHQATDHTFIASTNSDHRLQVSIHGKDGVFLRSIQLHEKGKWCITGIAVTMQLNIAVSMYDECQEDSTVLVA